MTPEMWVLFFNGVAASSDETGCSSGSWLPFLRLGEDIQKGPFVLHVAFDGGSPA